ncbi:MAG: hypothetical protein IPL04_00515 [Chitinophagaceae bacterium]|nr:hypothetical protein [Chitinophagaceae bacterium]
MKISFTILMFIVSFLLNSQYTLRILLTELGKVELRVGSIIKKEFIEVYKNSPKGLFTTYGEIQVQIVNITDASTNITLSGLKFSTPIVFSKLSSFIDLEEVPGLLQFIDFLNKNEIEKPENYTEYIFNSKDFQLYTYFSEDPGNKKNLPYWHYGVKYEKYYSSSNNRIELKVLNEIKEAVISFKEKFNKPLPNVPILKVDGES